LVLGMAIALLWFSHVANENKQQYEITQGKLSSLTSYLMRGGTVTFDTICNNADVFNDTDYQVINNEPAVPSGNTLPKVTSVTQLCTLYRGPYHLLDGEFTLQKK